MDPELKQIRTFQGDVASTIGKQKESLVSIQRAEHSRAEALAPQAEEFKTDTNKLKLVAMILGSFILLSAGVLGGWYTYKEYVKKTAPPVISTPSNRLIFAARMVEVAPTALSRSELLGIVGEESAPGGAVGEVVHINVPASTREFMEVLEVRAPGNLLRSFDQTFMLGVLEGEKPSVFILVRLSSFENAFAGMLAWESNMVEDIGPLFSTRANMRNIEQGSTFDDLLTRNKDARVLYNPEGEVVLLYSFFDNNTLIITDSEMSLGVLLGRLSTELLSR